MLHTSVLWRVLGFGSGELLFLSGPTRVYVLRFMFGVWG